MRHTIKLAGALNEEAFRIGMLVAPSGTEITRLGKMLLRYLDLIPEWYQR